MQNKAHRRTCVAYSKTISDTGMFLTLNFGQMVKCLPESWSHMENKDDFLKKIRVFTVNFLVINSLSPLMCLCNTKLQCLVSCEENVTTCFFIIICNLPLWEMKNKTPFRLIINKKKCTDSLAVRVNYRSDSMKTSTERFTAKTEPSTQPQGSRLPSWSKHHLPLPWLRRTA